MWFIYQIFLIQMLWFNWYGLGTPHARRASPCQRRRHPHAASVWRVHVREPSLTQFCFFILLFWFLTESLDQFFWQFSRSQNPQIRHNQSPVSADHEIMLLAFWDQAVEPGCYEVINRTLLQKLKHTTTLPLLFLLEFFASTLSANEESVFLPSLSQFFVITLIFLRDWSSSE